MLEVGSEESYNPPVAVTCSSRDQGVEAVILIRLSPSLFAFLEDSTVRSIVAEQPCISKCKSACDLDVEL